MIPVPKSACRLYTKLALFSPAEAKPSARALLSLRDFCMHAQFHKLSDSCSPRGAQLKHTSRQICKVSASPICVELGRIQSQAFVTRLRRAKSFELSRASSGEPKLKHSLISEALFASLVVSPCSHGMPIPLMLPRREREEEERIFSLSSIQDHKSLHAGVGCSGVSSEHTLSQHGVEPGLASNARSQ